MSSGNKKLVAGAVSLAMAGMISRILGVIYIVPLQNMAKDYAMGLYSMAYSIYLVVLMVSTAGIPLAVSKLISERIAVGDYAGADQMYKVGGRYLTLAGLFFWLLMFALGGVLATWMGDPQASTAIRALSFALLFVPLLAAMRGYVQGHQEMALSGNAQVVEQLVRVAVILFGVFAAVSLDVGANVTAAVATFGAVLGAIVSLVFLARHVVRIRRESRKKYRHPSTEPNKVVLKKLLVVAIPITLTSLVNPLEQLIDSFTITNLLMSGMGWVKEQAAAEYGIFAARALRLVAFPLSLAVAIGFSLMPAITEAIAKKNAKLRNERVLGSLRLTGFFAFPMAVGMYVLATPLDVALFQDDQGADTIAVAAFLAIFASYEVVCAYLLQSLGRMYLPIRFMFIGLFVKLILNVGLVPVFGIKGAAYASLVGYFVSGMLALLAVRKATGMKLPLGDLFVKPMLAAAVMGGLVHLWTWVPLTSVLPWEREANLLIIAGGGVIGAGVFLGLMLGMKGITAEELGSLPVLGRLVRKMM
jgi:PST family polysaccharide transporter